MPFKQKAPISQVPGELLASAVAYGILLYAGFKLAFSGAGRQTAPITLTPHNSDPSAVTTTLPGKHVGSAKSRVDSPGQSWWHIIKALYGEIVRDRVVAVAGGVSYFGLLALFPTVTALVSLYGLLNDRSQAAADLAILANVIPESAFSIINDQVERIVAGDGLALGLASVVSLALALWSSNSGMKAMMDALNVAYGVAESRSFLVLNAVSLIFTLSGIIFVLAMLAMIAVVPALLNFFWLGGSTEWLIWAGRWPLAVIIVALALSVLYRWGASLPDAKWRWISPGSALATVLLVLLSMGFSTYAASFGKFNETYGALGAVIAFMTWLWLSSIVVLAGAEFNAVLDARSGSGRR